MPTRKRTPAADEDQNGGWVAMIKDYLGTDKNKRRMGLIAVGVALLGLNAKIDSNSGRIDSQASRVTHLREDVGDLQDDVDHAKAQARDVTSEVDHIQSAISKAVQRGIRKGVRQALHELNQGQ